MSVIERLIDQQAANILKAGYGMKDWDPYRQAAHNLIVQTVKECLSHIQPMSDSGDIDDVALEQSRANILSHFGLSEHDIE